MPGHDRIVFRLAPAADHRFATVAEHGIEHGQPSLIVILEDERWRPIPTARRKIFAVRRKIVSAAAVFAKLAALRGGVSFSLLAKLSCDRGCIFSRRPAF